MKKFFSTKGFIGGFITIALLIGVIHKQSTKARDGERARRGFLGGITGGAVVGGLTRNPVGAVAGFGAGSLISASTLREEPEPLEEKTVEEKTVKDSRAQRRRAAVRRSRTNGTVKTRTNRKDKQERRKARKLQKRNSPVRNGLVKTRAKRAAKKAQRAHDQNLAALYRQRDILRRRKLKATSREYRREYKRELERIERKIRLAKKTNA